MKKIIGTTFVALLYFSANAQDYNKAILDSTSSAPEKKEFTNTGFLLTG